jgi:hypothetical protein
MKSLFQIAVLLIAVVSGIFGVTFLTQYIRKPVVTASSQKQDEIQKKLIEQPLKTAYWAEVTGIPGYESFEVEKGSKNHYDFLIANATDKAVTIVLETQYACTCAKVKVYFGIVPEAGRTQLKAMKSYPVGPRLEPYLAGTQWSFQDYDRNRGPCPPETVPASDSSGPQFAIVRFDWEAMAIKSTRMEANFVARQGPAADYLKFEVPLTVCPPVIASTDDLKFGDLNPGETRTASLVIWSPTRDHFDATAELAAPDPCLTVAPPRPLTKEQLAALPGELLRREAVTKVVRTQSAYEIEVTAHERLGDNQLELGPLFRRLVISRGTDTEMAVKVVGVVRGPIQIGKAADLDRVDRRVFRAEAGAESMIEIKSATPGIMLSIDHVTPDSVKAVLKPVASPFGTTTWRLTVVVPPDAQAGPLPPESAIYLKTDSKPPRRVRIPVAGNASG